MKRVVECAIWSFTFGSWWPLVPRRERRPHGGRHFCIASHETLCSNLFTCAVRAEVTRELFGLCFSGQLQTLNLCPPCFWWCAEEEPPSKRCWRTTTTRKTPDGLCLRALFVVVVVLARCVCVWWWRRRWLLQRLSKDKRR